MKALVYGILYISKNAGAKAYAPESCACVKGTVAFGDSSENKSFRIRAISTVNFATLVRPLLS